MALSVQMKNKDSVYGYEFELNLPEGVTVATVTDSFGDTYYDVSLTETRTNSMRHTLASSMIGNKLKVLCYSDKKSAFVGNEGEVAQIVLNVPQGFDAGDYPITLTNEAVSLGTSTPVIKLIASTLTVVAGKIGDTNGDELINVGDITSLAGYILGDEDDDFNVYTADVNEDGNVNVGDITAIASMILDGTANSAKARIAADRALEGQFSLPRFAMKAGASVTVPVNLTTLRGAFSSYQFDVVVPEGFSIKEIISNSARSGRLDNFSYAKLHDGTYRVLAYSVTDASVRGTEGAIAYITLTADAVLAENEYELSISNAVLANRYTAYSASDITTAITVGDATGISVQSAPDNAESVYDMNGRKVKSVDAMSHGTYIMGNKKYAK